MTLDMHHKLRNPRRNQVAPGMLLPKGCDILSRISVYVMNYLKRAYLIM